MISKNLAHRIARSDWWIYVLFSPSTNAHYVGITVDPDKRLAKHRKGKGCKTTSHSTDWEYVDLKFIGDFEDATDLERYMHVLNLNRLNQITPTHFSKWLVSHPLARRSESEDEPHS
jgi:predicted GIY-YIG superfamily endonuclease